MNRLITASLVIIIILILWLVYISILNAHTRMFYKAFSMGSEETKEEYERLLEFENSRDILDAKCMMLDKEWIENQHRRPK